MPRRDCRAKAFLILLVGAPWLGGPVLHAASEREAIGFDGERAYEHVRELVELGPRFPGSPGHAEAQAYLLEAFQATKLKVERDAFVARTPEGEVPMCNLLAVHEGAAERVLIFAGHYDTKRLDEIRFVGANDGGASAAVIAELARAVAAREHPPRSTVWFVLFDGEEALVRWTAQDSLYGSRHLASRLLREGLLSRVRAMVLVDMVGDRDLGILREGYSTRWLQDLVWDTAERLGHGSVFLSEGFPMEDDHVPFLRLGVSAVDLIDFDYGPSNAYWHSADDTLDKVAPSSLQAVGETLLGVLDRLDELP